MTTTARVIRAQSRAVTALLDQDEVRLVVPKSLRRRHEDDVDPVVVGDVVEIEMSAEPVVVGVRPRRNSLGRRAVGQMKRQVVAANLDLALLVLAAHEPAWKPATLDRYLVMALSGGVPPVAVINKIDLEPELRENPELAAYPPLGIPVFFVSAREGTGVPELAAHLAGKTSALLGPSGAGKTSLVNRLVPRAEGAVQDVSERTGKGKHTTTWVEMLPLPQGGWLVDSPGLRALDLSLVHPEDLAGHFPDLAPLIGSCRFPDCRHMEEPDCGVKNAVRDGGIAPHRYDSYRRILKSLERGAG